MTLDLFVKKFLNSKPIKTGVIITGGALGVFGSSLDNKVLGPKDAYGWQFVDSSRSADGPLIEEYDPKIEIASPRIEIVDPIIQPSSGDGYQPERVSTSKPPTWVDNYVADFVYGTPETRAEFLDEANKWIQANGDDYVVNTICLLFNKDKTKAHTSIGCMDTSIGPNPEDNYLPTLRDAWNAEALDILTVLLLLQQQDGGDRGGIKVLNKAKYNLIDASKDNGLPAGKTAINVYDTSYMFNYGVAIPNHPIKGAMSPSRGGLEVSVTNGSDWIDLVYGGSIGGKSREEVMKRVEVFTPPYTLKNFRRHPVLRGTNSNFALELGTVNGDGTYSIWRVEPLSKDGKHFNNVVYTATDTTKTLLQNVPLGYVVPPPAITRD